MIASFSIFIVNPWLNLPANGFTPFVLPPSAIPRQQCSSKTYICILGIPDRFLQFSYLQWNLESCVVWRDVFQAWLDDGFKTLWLKSVCVLSQHPRAPKSSRGQTSTRRAAMRISKVAQTCMRSWSPKAFLQCLKINKFNQFINVM